MATTRTPRRSATPANPAKTKDAFPQSRVWIELDPPLNTEHAEHLCALANTMLARLNGADSELAWQFGWDAERRCYTYGGHMGSLDLPDRGHWFRLDYLGRNLEA
jgi:hypothetical protein